MMRKIALIFVFLSFLCITVSLVMPWFQGHYHGTGDGDYTYLIEEHFYLNEVKKYD